MKNVFSFIRNALHTSNKIPTSIKVSEQKIKYLIEHAEVHTRFDFSRAAKLGMVARKHYNFGYLALRHFILGGTLKVWNKAIGAASLLDPDGAKNIFSKLYKIVNDLPVQVANDPFSTDEMKVELIKLKKGSCVLVVFPKPEMPTEAHMVGIITNEKFDHFDEDTKENPAFFLKYFVLEYDEDENESPITVVSEWTTEGRHNLGQGPAPDKQKFIAWIDKNI